MVSVLSGLFVVLVSEKGVPITGREFYGDGFVDVDD